MDCLWRGLSTEGNLRFKIDRASLIAEVNLPFGKYKPRGGAYIWRGDLTEGFLRYWFGRLIFGGAYFRNFAVF